MGLAEKLTAIAKACAKEVIIPDQITCCGFAGDKGFSTPELNESALRTLKDSIPENCKEGFSTSRTCEIGLSYHSRIEYKSIIYLVDRCTQPKLTPVHSTEENERLATSTV
jgi:D-lactate dehydrogenase